MKENYRYRTIESEITEIYREKGSKFIGIAIHVDSEDSIKTHLDNIKKKYNDATHHCYAWRLGIESNVKFRYYDDGEPPGTAGKPIYNQILSFDLTNVLVVVVRYFGGTKLGTSGLFNAYKTTAYITLSNAIICEKTIDKYLILIFSHEKSSLVNKILKNYKVKIIKQKYEEKIHFLVSINANIYDNFIQQLTNISNITIDTNISV